MPKVVIIGAGIGGLTAGALLAQEGLEVEVLEAHTYPGGLARTFFHRGFRFDAGATLLASQPLMALEKVLKIQFPLEFFPEGAELLEVVGPSLRIPRPVGRLQEAEVQASLFGPQVRRFWSWQAERAEALWELAPGLPFLPAEPWEAWRLIQQGSRWLVQRSRPIDLLLDLVRPVSAWAPPDPHFRRFLDSQLLIAAQATAQHTFALFGAAALDLPHRQPAWVHGGMGAVAQTLAEAIQKHGGALRYRHRALRLKVEGGKVRAVEVLLGGRRRGERAWIEGDFFVANLPPGDLQALWGQPQDPPADAWGAVVLHAGIPSDRVPPGPLYRHWIGPGLEVFLSLSPAEDPTRAPTGFRALSASAHTPWALWQGQTQEEYHALKAAWAERLLQSAEHLLPGLREEAPWLLVGTPRTYTRYTLRRGGWVGGYPQTHPLRFRSPATSFPNLLRVGESIFPGQSVPASVLGGERVARLVLHRLGVSVGHPTSLLPSPT
jgi:phytoene dehydrogenase-like protein